MYEMVKIGVCPIGKFVFSHEDAKVYKKRIEEKLDGMKVNHVGIDIIIKDGIVRSYEDVEPVVEFLKAEKIDCLFIPHCNFGTESAAGLIAKRLGVPTLLWGPRDEAPLEDGTRLRDSLCGMFATSKVLKKLGVPFTYIENCALDEAVFQTGIDQFIRTANIVKMLKNAKIGLIGNRIDFFWSTIINENELLQKFGIEILPIDLAKVIRMAKEAAINNKEKYAKEMAGLALQIDISAMSENGMFNVFGLRDVMYQFAVDNKLTALAVESFMSLIEELGACVSYAQAAVSDMGIPCVSESDIHGAISSIIAEAASLNTATSFLADLTIRHPNNDNGLLLWHDAFPLSLKDPATKGSLGSHWILKDFLPGMCHWKLKEGNITIVRFDGEADGYKLLAEKVKTIPGPFNQNTYVWVELEDWKKFEKKVIEGPYIHHTACIYGEYTGCLKEASKYIDWLEFDDK